MTIEATEFLRRFFSHVLPKGFVRIGSSDFSRIVSVHNGLRCAAS